MSTVSSLRQHFILRSTHYFNTRITFTMTAFFVAEAEAVQPQRIFLVIAHVTLTLWQQLILHFALGLTPI